MINKKTIASTIFVSLMLSAPVHAKFSYANDDLAQYNQSHSCSKCDLSGAKLNGYKNSILDGSILISAELEGNFSGSSFTGGILTQANASGIAAMVTNFSGARCNYTKFYKTSLSGANFQNADLSKVNFKAANLSSADFTNASLKGANLDYSILIGAKLTQEQLKSAKSYYCAILPDGTLAPPEYELTNCASR